MAQIFSTEGETPWPYPHPKHTDKAMPDVVRKQVPAENVMAIDEFTQSSAAHPRWPRPLSLAATLIENPGAQLRINDCVLLLALTAAFGLASGVLLRIWRSHA